MALPVVASRPGSFVLWIFSWKIQLPAEDPPFPPLNLHICCTFTSYLTLDMQMNYCRGEWNLDFIRGENNHRVSSIDETSGTVLTGAFRISQRTNLRARNCDKRIIRIRISASENIILARREQHPFRKRDKTLLIAVNELAQLSRHISRQLCGMNDEQNNAEQLRYIRIHKYYFEQKESKELRTINSELYINRLKPAIEPRANVW